MHVANHVLCTVLSPRLRSSIMNSIKDASNRPQNMLDNN
ncbi:hypothetical protein VDGD_21702 [Verticillium dahliae]|nr:hypothetical protein VDGD_21702 [Verticillium dahliae]